MYHTGDMLSEPPKISELLNKVASKAKDKWKNIGLQLDIEPHDLNDISSREKDPILCYSEVFRLWKSKEDKPFTWATIVEALRAPSVEETRLATGIVEWLRLGKP